MPYSNPLIGRVQHIVHFYRSDEDLASSVATFFVAGLLGGCGCVAIATRDHSAAIASRLEACGIDIEHATRSGQLVIFDAEATLAEVFASGRAERAVFDRIAAQALQGVGARHSHVLVFGEMVGLLTARGDHATALRFEEWCNDALRDAPHVQMFCAYPKPGDIPAREYDAICCAHSAVL